MRQSGAMARTTPRSADEATERRDRLADALQLRRMTQAEVAGQLGANLASIRRWVDRGDPQPQPGPAPTRVTTETLAEVLDIPVDALTPGSKIRLALIDARRRIVAE